MSAFVCVDMMNYAVNIHQDGNLLEIVTNAGKPTLYSNYTVWLCYYDTSSGPGGGSSAQSTLEATVQLVSWLIGWLVH